MPEKNAASASAAIVSANSEIDSGEEDSDDEILEESPNGRWQKRRDKVTQRDVPGIDAAYLAMDTEEGVEVVWNEVNFSERKASAKGDSDYMRKVFDNLSELKHANIVKFYQYWITDNHQRVVFITEYMTSGSLKQFIKKAQKNKKPVGKKTWARWCRQILFALSYLHESDLKIVHGNLTCDTIFFQHNGLIKIGCVAPDTINKHVKTVSDPAAARNSYYIAPEYGRQSFVTQSDIYAFGVCALEMAITEILSSIANGTEGKPKHLDHDSIIKMIDRVEDPQVKAFIHACLEHDVDDRPSARELLLHPAIFECHSLKVFATHAVIQIFDLRGKDVETALIGKMRNRAGMEKGDKVGAEIKHVDGREGIQQMFKPSDLEKLLQEVRDGLHPLTGVCKPKLAENASKSSSTENLAEPDASETQYEVEERRVRSCVSCDITSANNTSHIVLTLKLEDGVQRQLSCNFTPSDTAEIMAAELVTFGFINEADRDSVADMIRQPIKDAPALAAKV
ncbi:nuclear receptor-binding protein-like [Oscarella lobularis]|uniref:nuclear receptor-binding protein-like n=1 Tax=Oscarella lobularis TaxID=121494 RepID=UPI0033131F7A